MRATALATMKLSLWNARWETAAQVSQSCLLCTAFTSARSAGSPQAPNVHHHRDQQQVLLLRSLRQDGAVVGPPFVAAPPSVNRMVNVQLGRTAPAPSGSADVTTSSKWKRPQEANAAAASERGAHTKGGQPTNPTEAEPRRRAG
ncbi:hypothetical protein DIPPA_03746 [Diplonema papillatum]|nr:hypothetical protein DIPPA_03746 [Diplonema papillatum]